jgi:NAD(P)-dependent dehydrogenase (short-subunit alcohol dehydrogenase family)
MRLLLAILALWPTLAVPALAAGPVPTGDALPQPVALVTGSDRGIGLALSEELARRGWRVVATCRDPAHADALKAFAATHSGITLEPLDVSDDAAIDRLAKKYRNQAIDVLVNNAGITGDLTRQHVGAIEPTGFEKVMRVNAYAPLRIAQAFLDSVAASRQKKIVAITSGAGSLTGAQGRHEAYYYSMSKSALNMAMRLLQNDVGARGVIVGIVSPGRVDTGMQSAYLAAAAAAGSPLSGPFLTATDSARALAAYIETLSPNRGGRFYSASGHEMPW